MIQRVSDAARDWRVSEALDSLTPIFQQFELTASEIQAKAEVAGMPTYAMWTAFHLYETIRKEYPDASRPLPVATMGY